MGRSRRRAQDARKSKGREVRKSTKRKPANPGAVRLRAVPWKIAAVFAPIEAIIDQIEHDGTVDIEARTRQPVFRDMNDGDLYTIPEALDGVVDFYVVLAGRTGKTYPTEPIRQLAAKIRYSSPITLEEVQRVRDSIASLRSVAGELTQAEALELTKITEIRAAVEREGRA